MVSGTSMIINTRTGSKLFVEIYGSVLNVGGLVITGIAILQYIFVSSWLD